jgi:hypothetical protein
MLSFRYMDGIFGESLLATLGDI